MPTLYRCIITNVGLAKMAAAVEGGGVPVVISELAVGDGDGAATTPDPNQAGLVNEVHRVDVNNFYIDSENPNWIEVEAVIGEDDGGFTVREAGVFDEEGDLIAIANYPSVYKPLAEEGTAGQMVLRMTLVVDNLDALTLTIDPSTVVATHAWVTANFSLGVLLPGGTTAQVLRKASNVAGDVEWFDPASGLNIVVDTVEETQVLTAAQTVVTLAVATTSGLAVYIDGIRLRNDEWTADSETQITLDEAAAGDENISLVQNDPTAGLTYLNSANKLSEIATLGSSAQAAAVGNLGLSSTADTVAAAVAAAISAVKDLLYPVGEVLITRRSANPSTWIGGTWVRYGEGRTLVSYNAADSAFDTLDKVAGAASVTLSTANLPAHTHTTGPASVNTYTSGGHTHAISAQIVDTSSTGSHAHDCGNLVGYTSVAPGHTHTIPSRTNAGTGNGYVEDADSGGTGTTTVTGEAGEHSHLVTVVGTCETAGTHTHTVTIPSATTGSSGSHTHNVLIPESTSSSVGSGTAFSTVQPSIVVHMWKRTA